MWAIIEEVKYVPNFIYGSGSIWNST